MKSFLGKSVWFMSAMALLFPGHEFAQERQKFVTWDLMNHIGMAGTLPTQSFVFTAGSVEGGNLYRGRVSTSPFCGINDGRLSPALAGKLTITVYYDSRAKLELMAGKSTDSPISPLALYQAVSSVRVSFDKGEPLAWNRVAITDDHDRSFSVPRGASKVIGVEIDYMIPLNRFENGEWVREKHTLQWNEEETTSFCSWPHRNTPPR
jgi:hypothetical protein